MANKMLIDATHAEETRVVVVDGNKVEEFDFESENKRQLAGNIYLAKVTRVEPSLQAAFVDYGGNRHGFLAFSEIHPDYYQIPVADREALMAEELAYDQSQSEDDDPEPAEKPASKPRRSRSRRSRSDKPRDADPASSEDGIADAPAGARDDDGGDTPRAEPMIPGMEMVDLDADDVDASAPDGEDLHDAGLQRQPNRTEPAPSEPALSEPALSEAGTADAVAEDAVPDAATDDDAPRKDDDMPPTTMAARHDGPDVVTHGDVAATDDAAAAGAEQGDGADDPSSDEDEHDGDSAPDTVADVDETDNEIESVGDDDAPEDIRPPRKPRPRRYKIQEVVKVRQIMLVQVVKEERGNKGAALTTYLSLAGRYCVLMPNTARGGGISRKITNVQDRKKLKQIATEIDVPRGAGLIVRTAGAKRTKPEIKRDYEYLQRLWEQIRELTLKSVAPAAIYAEGDLIKRTIRDLYNRDIDEVFVEGEAGYRIAKDFMKMIMPSHAKNVKHYVDNQPLFAKYQVESYLSEMFNPTVRLRSGGYIVIDVTEALVAVDVNSGKSTNEGSIEDTALKTNLEAAEEVARQMRLRDLAGLIVIDFIDMDERKNNAAVEKRLKDKLKTDRARIQMGRISGFGLLEMSRQRLRPGMIEATTKPCPHCHGTGLVRSDDSLALSILRELEEEGVRNRSGEVLVKAPVAIANYLINEKREHITRIEQRYGMAVRVEADVQLISPNFSVEKFKTATRKVEKIAPVISIDMSHMPDEDEDDFAADVIEADAAEAAADIEEPTIAEPTRAEPPAEARSEDDDGKPKKKRRRRRRRRGGNGGENGREGDDQTGADDTQSAEVAPVTAQAVDTADQDGPQEAAATMDTPAPRAEAEPDLAPATTTDHVESVAAPEAVQETAEVAPEGAAPAPAVAPEDPAGDAPAETVVAPEPAPAEEDPAPVAEDPDKPKKRGWWSQ